MAGCSGGNTGGSVTWEQLGSWWLEELGGDPAYEEEMAPLLLELLDPREGELYLDLGCGDGRLMGMLRGIGVRSVGCDLNVDLLRKAVREGAVVRCELPNLDWVRPGAFDGAYVGLVIEHLADEATLFAGASRSVKPGGTLAVMINHPIWTAPDSSPIEAEDGETLWRPGTYFGRGHSEEPAGRRKVRFYHRTMADLLNGAAEAGWALERMEERGVSASQVERTPDLGGQEHIPRLLGVRWKRR
jgi:SAM-dependent methyltransferase